MKDVNIVKYGFFDSKKQYPNVKKSPPRTVTTFELDYLLSCDDSAVSFVDGTAHALQPQTIILRKPGQISNSLLHFKCYCLHLQIEQPSPFFSEIAALPDYYPPAGKDGYKPLLEELFKHLSAAEKNAEDYFSAAKLLELLYRLKKDGNAKNKTPAFKRENEKIKAAIGYMKENFGQKITLQTLGKITGYTPNHFQKLFLDAVLISPQKYLENIRIKNAKYLLSQTEKPIAEIAYECGFSSQSHFSAAFKSAVKITPYAFRLSSMVVYE